MAERRAAAPRSPRRPLGAPMHIRAVMRRCTYDIKSALSLKSERGKLELSCNAVGVFLISATNLQRLFLEA
jgi:hypothetical protein